MNAFRLTVHQLRYDLRAFRRNRQARVATVLMPVLLLVIIVAVSGQHELVHDGDRTMELGAYLVPGLAAFAVAAAAFVNLTIDVVNQRESGVLKRRRASGAPAWLLVAGTSLTATVTSLLVTFVLLVIGGERYDLQIPSSALPALALTVVLGSAAFASLGYGVASVVRSASAAQPVVQLVVLPMYIISGVLVPASKLPRLVDDAARILPLQHLAAAMRHALDPAAAAPHLAVGDLLVLLAWAAAGYILALRRFSWLPSAAAA